MEREDSAAFHHVERSDAATNAPDNREASILARIIAAQSDIATADPDPRAVVDVVVARAQGLTRSDGAVVELLDGDDMLYWVGSGTAASQVGLRLKARTSLSGLCVRTGQVMKCDDSESDPRVDREACRRVGLRSMLVVPLIHDEQVVGVLKVMSGELEAYDALDVRTLELMSTLVAATIAHAVDHADMRAELAERKAAEQRLQDDVKAMAARVRSCIDNDGFTMVFQPIVNLRTRGVVGLEALARFTCEPQQTPDKWFDDARVAGLQIDLEVAAVRRALAVLERIPAEVYLSVNVSPVVASAIADGVIGRANASRIVLEVTEHAAVEDYTSVDDALAGLRGAGMRLAIDDAGAGFASLRHILRLEPEIIKLDISLTRNIHQQPRLRTLAAALVTFAATTDAVIVSEGIEVEAELHALRRLGIGFGQGYLLGRPEPLRWRPLEVYPAASIR